MTEKPTIYAIDYGTSNSLLAAANTDRLFEPASIDPLAKDSSILRSILFYPDNKTVFFGQNAINQYAEQNCEGRLFRSIKKYLPNPMFTATSIGNRAYKLEDIIATFLREMKTRADKHFKTEVNSVVLGRPARFSMDEKKDKLAQERLERAAKSAGFKEIEFFPEPLAAAFEYREGIDSEKILLVVDLGGGTSDFTVMKVHPGEFSKGDVLSLGGLSLAGDAMDGALMTQELAPDFGSKVSYKYPLANNILQMPSHIQSKLASAPDIALMTQKDIIDFIREVERITLNEEDETRVHRLVTLVEDNLGFRLFEAIESTKRELGEKDTATFSFPYPEIDLEADIEKTKFEEIISENVNKISEEMDRVVKDAGVTYGQIDIVCATGGTSKIPAVRAALLERLNEGKIDEFRSFHSIIQGLSRYAQSLLN